MHAHSSHFCNLIPNLFTQFTPPSPDVVEHLLHEPQEH